MPNLFKFLGLDYLGPKEPGCDHDWKLEPPTFSIGESFKQWDGPKHDYCTKCGARRRHPECNHSWERTCDDGNGMIVNGVKQVRIGICRKCGAYKYVTPKDSILWRIFHY